MSAPGRDAPPAAVDARRYTWCWTQAVWQLGAVLPMLAEDVTGAEEAGQAGLLRYVGRLVGEYCAGAVYLVTAYPRPLPPTAVRAPVALSRITDPELRELCAELISGPEPDFAIAELAGTCRRAIARTLEIIGPVPELISADHRHQALGQARDWLRLIDLVGEGDADYLPRPARPRPPDSPAQPANEIGGQP